MSGTRAGPAERALLFIRGIMGTDDEWFLFKAESSDFSKFLPFSTAREKADRIGEKTEKMPRREKLRLERESYIFRNKLLISSNVSSQSIWRLARLRYWFTSLRKSLHLIRYLSQYSVSHIFFITRMPSDSRQKSYKWIRLLYQSYSTILRLKDTKKKFASLNILTSYSTLHSFIY